MQVKLQDHQGLPRLDHLEVLRGPTVLLRVRGLLYNMWLLVDLLVQVSLDVEHRYKPRVTAKRFLNLARKNLAAG